MPDPDPKTVADEVFDGRVLRREIPLLKRFGILHLAYAVSLCAAAMSLFNAGGMVIAGIIIGVWIFIFSKDRLSPGCTATLIVMTLLICFCCLPIYFLMGSLKEKEIKDCHQTATRLFVAWYTYEAAIGVGSLEEKLTEEKGKLHHSWRVYLLPHLGYEDLYRQYDFEEAWNGPNNSELFDQMPPVYCCPGKKTNRYTSYFRIVGPKRNTPNKFWLIEDCTREIIWTDPQDLNSDEVIELFSRDSKTDCPHVYQDSLSTSYSGRTVLSVEGWTYTLPHRIPEAALRPFLDESRNPKEIWQLDWEYDSTAILNPQGILALGIFLLLTVLPIFLVNSRIIK